MPHNKHNKYNNNNNQKFDQKKEQERHDRMMKGYYDDLHSDDTTKNFFELEDMEPMEDMSDNNQGVDGSQEVNEEKPQSKEEPDGSAIDEKQPEDTGFVLVDNEELPPEEEELDEVKPQNPSNQNAEKDIDDMTLEDMLKFGDDEEILTSSQKEEPDIDVQKVLDEFGNIGLDDFLADMDEKSRQTKEEKPDEKASTEIDSDDLFDEPTKIAATNPEDLAKQSIKADSVQAKPDNEASSMDIVDEILKEEEEKQKSQVEAQPSQEGSQAPTEPKEGNIIDEIIGIATTNTAAEIAKKGNAPEAKPEEPEKQEKLEGHKNTEDIIDELLSENAKPETKSETIEQVKNPENEKTAEEIIGDIVNTFIGAPAESEKTVEKPEVSPKAKDKLESEKTTDDILDDILREDAEKQNLKKKEKAPQKPQKNNQQKEKQKSPEEKLFEAIEKFNKESDNKYTKNHFDDLIGSIKKANENPDKEMRKDVIMDLFRNQYLSEIQGNLNHTTIMKKNNNPTAPNYSTCTAQAAGLMVALETYLRESNILDKGLDLQRFGGVQPLEIRDMALKSFNSLPDQVKKNSQQEVNLINAQFMSADKGNKENISKSFFNQITQLNKDQGVNYSAKGIEDYLSYCWKNAPGADINAKRDSFMQSYTKFAKTAYENMASKSNEETDYIKQCADFNKFTRSMEEMCKAQGWMAPDEPHKNFGGVGSKDIQNIQLNAINKRPVDITHQVAQHLDKAMNGEPKPEQQFDPATFGKDQPENKGFTLASFSKLLVGKLKQPEENKTEKGIDNINARQTALALESLSVTHESRSRLWKLAHPFKYKEEKEAIDILQNGLKNNGYDDKTIEFYRKNPLTPDKDPFSVFCKHQLKQVDFLLKQNETIENAFSKYMVERNQNKLGKQIYVAEADNTKEIIHPDPQNTSPAVQINKNLLKNKDLTND